MDRFAKLVILASLVAAGSAQAGYAQLSPPSGFGGSAGTWTFAPSANDLRYGPTAYSPNALRVPVSGSSATMPAAYRFAANAPRVAAAAIFMNPYVRAGVGIASWLGVAGLIWDAVNNRWILPDNSYPVSDGYEYNGSPNLPYMPNAWVKSVSSLCTQFASAYMAVNSNRSASVVECVGGGSAYVKLKIQQISPPGTPFTDLWGISKRGSECPIGWFITPAGCSQTPPPKQVTEEEFKDLLAPKPMPETVPWELPKPTPLPVEQPVINPEPVPNPVPRPLFVPTGDPVPNPQYDPNAAPGPDNQPWIQPGVRVNPSPTPSEPWRVDVQPVNRPVPSPEPMPEPDSDDPPVPDKPSEEQIDFCAKNPDVLACQKLDEPNSEELPASEKPISISPDGGWGADNASCPAPKQITVQGRAIPIPFDLFCTWASGMRPIIIAMAWLSAAFILLGARNES